MNTVGREIYLGRKLRELQADKAIIFWRIIRRLAFAIVLGAGMIGVVYGTTDVAIGDKNFMLIRFGIMLPILVIFTLYPLVHLRDNIQSDLYETSIV